MMKVYLKLIASKLFCIIPLNSNLTAQMISGFSRLSFQKNNLTNSNLPYKLQDI